MQVGETVVAQRVSNGETALQRIVSISSNQVSRLVRVIVGRDTIWSTVTHPFVSADGKTIPAGNLRKGIWLRKAVASVILASSSVFVPEAQAVVVDSVAIVDTSATVYNLSIRNADTYFIGIEGVQVLDLCGVIKQLDEVFENFASLNPSIKKKIAEKLEQVGLTQKVVQNPDLYKTFIGNLAENTKLLQSLQAKHLDSWEFIFKARDQKIGLYKTYENISLLDLVAELRDKASVANTKLSTMIQNNKLRPIGNSTTSKAEVYTTTDEVIGKYIAMRQKASDSWALRGGAPQLETGLKDLKYFLENCSQVTNAGAYLHELLQTAGKFNGGTYGLKLLTQQGSIPMLSGLKLNSFEEELLPDPTDLHRMDMRFLDSEGIELLVETKNYGSLRFEKELEGGGTELIEKLQRDSFKNQFYAYLKRIDNLDELGYFFNARKGIKLEEVKLEFQKIFKIENSNGNNYIYDMLQKNNSSLLQSLGITNPNQGYQIFKTYIDDLNSDLYKFIIIQ
ncbi:hypothetical protein QNI19_38920 [Cytophagaceae bacterium DM2B3-1]|uniref:Hint domain-containing protein n=1 Tax=Xanthocytophaga flava TaxID=3048013 RepID=A0ABT7CYV4_9BACT|nr:hypothetical protein [Xanthocytophaga flavus]MDJ1498964.1 hypothetical protein [Xanthocytophaga flavus]